MTPKWTDPSLRPASGVAPDAENVKPPSVPGGSFPGGARTADRLPLNLSTLAQLIDSERVELGQVQAMLKCLHEVLLYADDDDSSMHADVAKVAGRLINQCVDRLGKLVRSVKAEAGADG